MNDNLTRREFVQFGSAGLLTSASSLMPFSVAAAAETMNIEEMVIINGLGGISNQNRWARNATSRNADIATSVIARIRSLDRRAIDDARASGTTAINVTLGYVAGPNEPYEYTVDDIASWNAQIRKYPNDLLKVWSADDVLEAKRENKIGIIFGFQNAASVGNNLDRVETFSNLGVKIIQLTYNDRNQFGDGSVVAENRGLTDKGIELVESLNSNKVLVDLSHSGENTCLDAIKFSKKPITISHTGCRALNDIPRNKTDDELRQVAEMGGVVGIYFMPFLKADGQALAEDVVHHIEHALDVCGEDHVGIGTDGDSTAIDDMQTYRVAIAEEVRQRSEAGIGAAGESSKIVPLIPDLMGPTKFQKLADMLSARGHSSSRIEKVLGTNFLRLMREIW